MLLYYEWGKLQLDFGLVDSFRVTNPKRRFYTYTHTNGTSRARLQRIYLSKDLKGNMEPMLKTHVLHELASDQPFLRLRACWVYGEFSGMTFQDNDHVKQVVDGIY